MLSMLTGMVPAGFNGADGQGGSGTIGAPGIGLDAPTTALILNELRIREAQLEELRRRLREAQRTHGFNAEREKELERLAAELAAAKVKAKQLELIAQNNRRTTAKLSPAELKKQLTEAEIRLEAAKLHLKDSQTLTDDLRKELKQNIEAVSYAREKGTMIRERLNRAAEEVRRTRETLAINEEELRDREKQLAAATRELAQSRSAVTLQKQTISNLQNSLDAAVKRGDQAVSENQNLERNLSFVRGRLSSTEQAYAALRDENTRNRQLAAQRNLEIQRLSQQLASTQNVLKQAVKDRSESRLELAAAQKNVRELERKEIEARVKAASAEKQIAATTKMLETVGVRTKADVHSCYADAATLLRLTILENRIVVDQQNRALYCIPLVELKGKTVLISNFDNISGTAHSPLNFRNIKKLSYRAAAPGGKDAVTLEGSVYVNKADPRVAAIEAKVPGRKPLKTIYADDLRRRGMENLYLFKTNSSGKESTALGNRCSLDFTAGGDVLYIRNSRSTSEVKAVPGDLIITKEGEFAGVVVASESLAFSNRENARCLLFTKDFSWDKEAVAIPTTKGANEKYYSAFAREMGKFYKKVLELNIRDR